MSVTVMSVTVLCVTVMSVTVVSVTGKLKAYSRLKTPFSVQVTPEKFGNATITGHFEG